jgi:hypothetical protein
MGIFDKIFGRNERISTPTPHQRESLRSVPGAQSYSDKKGEVIYNLLTPHMQQFMGRCVSAVKKSGISAKGTGQFSILVGERSAELRLDKFYQPEDDPKHVENVVNAAQKLNGGA